MNKDDRNYVGQVARWVEDTAKLEPLDAIAFCDAMCAELNKIRTRLLTDSVNAARYVLPETL